MEDTLNRIELLAHAPVDTLEKKMEQYTQWSSDYEKDVNILDYNSPKLCVDLLYKQTVAGSLCLNDESKIIDFAAGTGLVGEFLKEKRFTGQIDAQDGSLGMLKEAKTKGIYTNIHHSIIKPGTDLNLTEQQYDIGFLCGALSDSQIHPLCLKIMLQVLKINGIFIFSTRSNKSNLKYKNTLESEIQNLSHSGIIEKVVVEEVKNFERATSAYEADDANCDEKYPFISGTIYCYKRLK